MRTVEPPVSGPPKRQAWLGTVTKGQYKKRLILSP